MEGSGSDTAKIYKRIGKYSLWLAVFGIISYLMFFPQGIYYCFFLGVMAVAAAIIVKRAVPSGATTAAIIIGIIDIGISLFAFYGVYCIYAYLQDPELGPAITQMIADMLSQYGVPIETFMMMMVR